MHRPMKVAVVVAVAARKLLLLDFTLLSFSLIRAKAGIISLRAFCFDCVLHFSGS